LTPSTEQVQLYPNPSSVGEEVYVRLPNDEVSEFGINIVDANGSRVADFHIKQQSHVTLPNEFEAGCYFVRVTWTNYLGESQTEMLKWIKYD
jgi:NDP-sugar pyrophosphorylase family protein